jgi:uncharacterized protein YdcH (DUF465 family)
MSKRSIEEIVESSYQKLYPKLDETIKAYGSSENQSTIDAVSGLKNRRTFVKGVLYEALAELDTKDDSRMREILRSITRPE